MPYKNFFWLGKSFSIFLSLVLTCLVIAAINLNGSVADSIIHLLWVGVGITGFLLLCVILIQLTYAYNWLGTPIVLKPIHEGGTEVAIIFIQGEDISVEQYCPVAQSIQNAAPDLSIWVSIPKFIGNSPVPREIGLAIDQSIKEMQKEGMPETDNIFFVAHSVGGIAIQKYLKSFPERGKGQILMGSFLEKGYVSKLNEAGQNVIQYIVPTLTIGGTLDGLARITRIATGFWYQQLNASKLINIENFPVVAIDGATHMQFASGEAPAYVADYDLQPRALEEEVHQKIGKLVYNFICLILPNANAEASSNFLKEERIKTQQLLQPLLNAFVMEGYNGFKPACYCSQEDNPRNDPRCTPYSPWIQDYANPIMAGSDLSPAPFGLKVIDSFHRSYTYNPFSHPSVHIPQVRNSCDGQSECTLTISSVTQALYNFLNFFDTGFFPIAAFSLRAKLNSRQKIWTAAGVPNPNYQETDGASRGNQINQYVYKWALENAGQEARYYFKDFGLEMGMGEDSIPIVAAGPLWIWVYPKYNYVTINNEQFYQVKARVMKTPTDYFIRSASGMHYCQLLSPAAAMEWIYIDGLRAKASLSGTTINYGPLGGGLDKIIRFLLRIALRQTRTKGLLKWV
ncbi:MAG: alpha/beta hydrolase family protein [Nostoc sp.]